MCGRMRRTRRERKVSFLILSLSAPDSILSCSPSLKDAAKPTNQPFLSSVSFFFALFVLCHCFVFPSPSPQESLFSLDKHLAHTLLSPSSFSSSFLLISTFTSCSLSFLPLPFLFFMSVYGFLPGLKGSKANWINAGYEIVVAYRDIQKYQLLARWRGRRYVFVYASW